MTQMTLSPTLGRTRRRHGEDCRNDMIRRPEVESGICFAPSFLQDSVLSLSLLELQAGIERWESYVSRCEKKSKDKLDNEIKLAGHEALVPGELEKHLILNSNRWRTFAP